MVFLSTQLLSESPTAQGVMRTDGVWSDVEKHLVLEQGAAGTATAFASSSCRAAAAAAAAHAGHLQRGRVEAAAVGNATAVDIKPQPRRR